MTKVSLALIDAGGRRAAVVDTPRYIDTLLCPALTYFAFSLPCCLRG
ncbi:MAG: hypothetical protein LBN28_01790 [Desulfovibrio sp.]|nr:hypothetical protein [Desulfovibrio sp.]